MATIYVSQFKTITNKNLQNLLITKFTIYLLRQISKGWLSKQFLFTQKVFKSYRNLEGSKIEKYFEKKLVFYDEAFLI